VNLRDSLRCRVCGRQPTAQENYHRGFEYHHVQPLSAGGSDETTNIVLLCHDCHTAHHRGRLTLPHFSDLEMEQSFACHNCRAELDIDTVTMNCGWYRCNVCDQTVHLWAHCDYEESSTHGHL
jgi:hypothetical protein